MQIIQGRSLREEMGSRELIPFIGVYDVFSASIAGRYFDGLFLSGFGFAASQYGLPDIGFIAWPDIVSWTQRVRTILPRHHLLVDIDDGYCDTEAACHVASVLESVGASGIVLEDQQRPRRCGHFEGKRIMELGEFLPKLKRVLETRRELVVVARTDAAEEEEILRRARAFAEAGADAILVDAVHDLEMIRRLRAEVEPPLLFNQIAGGKSPLCSFHELTSAGARLIIYSTPCLFAAQEAMETALGRLRDNDGLLDVSSPGAVGVQRCTAALNDNMARRDTR